MCLFIRYSRDRLDCALFQIIFGTVWVIFSLNETFTAKILKNVKLAQLQFLLKKYPTNQKGAKVRLFCIPSLPKIHDNNNIKITELVFWPGWSYTIIPKWPGYAARLFFAEIFILGEKKPPLSLRYCTVETEIKKQFEFQMIFWAGQL